MCDTNALALNARRFENADRNPDVARHKTFFEFLQVRLFRDIVPFPLSSVLASRRPRSAHEIGL